MLRRSRAALSPSVSSLRWSLMSRYRFRSTSCPDLAPGMACRITLSSERMMRVLPVPGGPWISVIGCLSRAARRAASWLPLYAAAIAAFNGPGSSHDECAEVARGAALRMVCAKGSEGNACSASHSRAIVDMLARCIRYHALRGAESALRTARNRDWSSSFWGLLLFAPPPSFTATAVVLVSLAVTSGRKNRTRILLRLSRPST
mmetsp:Transcript_19595/g.49046  ORF Transcript_19595/g.49046 Transcript_19595/m.49046 type:complete len:204 (-) Transcript_19595:58-669(-)